jgi:hypothetical protein
MNPIDIELLMKLFHGEDLKLKSTHQKLCVPIVLRIYKKMLIGIKFPSLKIHGDLIIDGHHRYLASKLAGIPLDTVPTGKSSATLVTKWSEVMLVLDDWDTEAKIKMLNEIDASFNGIAVELLTELLQ